MGFNPIDTNYVELFIYGRCPPLKIYGCFNSSSGSLVHVDLDHFAVVFQRELVGQHILHLDFSLGSSHSLHHPD